MTSEIVPHVWLPEPKLTFHASGTADLDIHPLRGLAKFGPFSRGLVPDPVRLATIAPSGRSARLQSFVVGLESEQSPRERREYLPKWPGFSNVFGLRLNVPVGSCAIELDPGLEQEMRDSNGPHIALADQLVRAIQRLQGVRSEFDLLLIYLPKDWEAGFEGTPEEDFDLHDHLKATTASLGIPIQIIREDRALAYHCQASVMWRIGLALYAKSGGIPWKLAGMDPETAYIGISYAIRPQSANGSRFITCCSQVFDAAGAGVEFVAYDAHEFEVHRDNPFLSRTEMFRVMTRSMELYRRRHTGNSPRRVMVHKTTEFKEEEIQGCLEAFHLCEDVHLVQIAEDIGWRGVKFDRLGARSEIGPAPFPVDRGTLVGLGPRQALLWTHGDVRGINNDRSFFKGARSTPRPLQLIRHAGHGPWDDSAQAILGLTKMNWNNDSVYDNLPVTLGYANVLARVIKRMPSLRRTPYQFRFFM